MSQTRPCVECHEPDLAYSGLARQGLRWGSARRRLAIGSYVCGRSQAGPYLGTLRPWAQEIFARAPPPPYLFVFSYVQLSFQVQLIRSTIPAIPLGK